MISKQLFGDQAALSSWMHLNTAITQTRGINFTSGKHHTTQFTGGSAPIC